MDKKIENKIGMEQESNVEKKFENLFKKAREVKLSETEKITGLRNLQQITAEVGSRPIRSPYMMRELFLDPLFGWRFRKKVGLMLAALLIVLYGGMTSFAAKDAVPGDALYPVKINFNERIQNFFALGENQRIRVETDHALERMQEIQKILSSGPVDKNTKEQAESTFEKNKNILIDLSKKQSQAMRDTINNTITSVSKLFGF